MTRRSTHALLGLGSLILILTSCGPGRASTEVAANWPAPQPSPTRAPKQPTATPKPPTATPLPPTPEPTTAPSATPAGGPDAAAQPAAPQVDAPAGWIHYDTSAAGFTFALPPQWKIADLDREDADELIEEMINEVPEMGLLNGSAQDLLAQGIKIIGCDCNEMLQTGAEPVTLNVIAQTTQVPLPFAQAVAQTIGALEAMPFTVRPINHVRIPHPNAEAEAIQYRMSMSDPSGKQRTLTATQYLLQKDRRIVVVTLTASVMKAEELTPTFYKIIQTFRVTAATSRRM